MKGNGVTIFANTYISLMVFQTNLFKQDVVLLLSWSVSNKGERIKNKEEYRETNALIMVYSRHHGNRRWLLRAQITVQETEAGGYQEVLPGCHDRWWEISNTGEDEEFQVAVTPCLMT